MPEWITLVFGAFATIGGLTGLAAYVRARGQNRVDDRRLTLDEQIAFRADMRGEIAALRTKIAELEKSKDATELVSAEQGKQLTALEVKNSYQAEQLAAQATEIRALREQNAQQAAQIAALTDERAAYLERLKIAEAKNDFMERENGDLRRENQRLREKLPLRTEEPT